MFSYEYLIKGIYDGLSDVSESPVGLIFTLTNGVIPGWDDVEDDDLTLGFLVILYLYPPLVFPRVVAPTLDPTITWIVVFLVAPDAPLYVVLRQSGTVHLTTRDELLFRA